MRYRTGLICAALLTTCLVASAKKKKVILPADVLQARTAWVIVDPDTGIDLRNPNSNNLARGAVENALAKWGRLQPVTSASLADLIIVIRKGNGRMVEPTIGGTPMNAPPPMIGQRTDSGVNGSARTGPPPFGQSDPHPQMEAGDTQDSFAVYRCNRGHDNGNPLDAPAVWRYSGKDALDVPAVPAVDAFRKTILEAEKQQDAKP